MSPLTDRQLAKKLRPDSRPEPPAGLLDELRRQIPAEVKAPAPADRGNLLPFRRPLPRRVWLAAASIVTLIGGGGLTWLALRHNVAEQSVAEPHEFYLKAESPAETRAGSAEATQPQDLRALGYAGAPSAAPPASAPAYPGLAPQRRAAAAPAESEAAQRMRVHPEPESALLVQPPPAPQAARRFSVERLRRDQEQAPPVAAQDEMTVTAESPLLDERRISTGATVSQSELNRILAQGQAPRPAAQGGRVAANEAARKAAPARQQAPARGDVAAAAAPEPVLATPPEPPLAEMAPAAAPAAPAPTQPPSTGGTAEPNDQPYGDVFFKSYGTNPFVDSEDDRLSTFALDVDTGSYNVVRRYLNDGHLPPADAVRVEELVNAFDYADAPPSKGDFALTAEAAPDPWAPGDRYVLARFAVKAREIPRHARKSADLLFVVDVSGSMSAENRLELVKQSLHLLLGELDKGDRVGLVVYGSDARTLLPLTEDKVAADAAIARLQPEGATNAEAGLKTAYDLIARSGRAGAIHRLILCSDGVANVGRTGPESILGTIGEAAKKGVELTTVGFGMGNYNDTLMEQLADRGNGRYAYVDSLDEARRIFVESLTGTLQTIAQEARAQLEVDPRVVSRWRLLGYENRDVADEKFRDDTIDAGEVGAGHAVTALYELKLRPDVPPNATLAVLHLRWRPAEGGKFQEIQQPLRRSAVAKSWESASRGFRLATVVGRFAEVLRGSYWAKQGAQAVGGEHRGDDLAELARRAAQVSEDWPRRERVAELVSLIGRARDLRRAP